MLIRNDMDVSYVRIFHASPDAPPIDIYINGGPIFKDISFKDFSEYIQLPMKEYKIEVFKSGQRSNPLIIQNIQIGKKEVITIAVVENFKNIQLMPYVEGNSDYLPVNESRLRVIYLSPDAPKIDVLIDESLVFKGVGFLDATIYEQLSSKTYSVVVNITDINDIILISKIKLESKKVYTIYIVGNQPYLSVIQSLDGITFIRFK